MPMPLKDQVKLNQIVARIQSGHFDENDVDGLLIKLRPYAKARHVFREVSHFVAHSDARNQGLAHESITGFVDAMRFFQEYAGPKRPLDLGQPFPAYIFRLFLSQARLSDKVRLKADFRMSPDSLIKKVRSSFGPSADGLTYSWKNNKGGVELAAALQFVTGFIHSRPAFHLTDFHKELKEVMLSENVAFQEQLWDAQADRMSLAILCLVSNTSFQIGGKNLATCKLDTENHFRIMSGERFLPTGGTSGEPSSFGTLMVLGQATVHSDTKPPLQVTFPLIDTDLNPHDHCHHGLFTQDNAPADFGDCIVEVINFAPDMALTADFKLVRADALAQ